MGSLVRSLFTIFLAIGEYEVLGLMLTRTQIDGLAVRAVGIPLLARDCDNTIIQYHPVEVECYEVVEQGWWEKQETDDLLTGQTADSPYGMTLWPGAVALIRRLASLPPTSLSAKGFKVLELGAGNGACSLAAASLGCSDVLATDISLRALGLIEAAALDGGLAGALGTAVFDVCGPEALPPADLVLVSDMLYEPSLAEAVAGRVAEAVARGSAVAVSGDPARAARSQFLTALKGHASQYASSSSSSSDQRCLRLPCGGGDVVYDGRVVSCHRELVLEPPVVVALPAMKWKAKKAEVWVVDGDLFQWSLSCLKPPALSQPLSR